MDIKIKKRFEYKDLPSMAEILGDVDRIAADITIGETLFFKEHGVKSELEYKKKAIQQGVITKHSHIGWNSWEETAKNLEYIYKELERRGSYISRFGFILDWVMGVPEEYRHKMQKGTGLILNTPKEWAALGQVVPVQPHMSDHMIGSPNALPNTIEALRAGVTSIGNVSHYFTYEYPGVDMERERTISSLRAFHLMGKLDGTIVHSNLDDGFGNQFHDLTSITGWAMMERYLVEELLGARMTFSYGNLFSDPMGRIIIHTTMESMNSAGTPGTMIFGNTVDYGLDYHRNFGALSSFSLADAIFQRHTPTGHAVASVPVSEASRIPSADEIVDGHLCVDMMIEKSQFFEPYINWDRVESEKNLYIACGKVFFERMMNGLDDLGVDIHHAGEVFAALKAIGPAQLEEFFGVGSKERGSDEKRKPVRPTDMIKNLEKKKEDSLGRLKDIEGVLKDVRVILAATDIHDYGKGIAKAILTRAGAVVFDLGTYVTTTEIVETLMETEAQVVVISTYNGIALTYARDLKDGMDKSEQSPLILMGGLLTENQDGGSLAVDVKAKIDELGINAENNMDNLVKTIKKSVQV